MTHCSMLMKNSSRRNPMTSFSIWNSKTMSSDSAVRNSDIVLDLEFENAIDEAPVEVAHAAVVESPVTEVQWQTSEEEPVVESASDVSAAEPVAPASVAALEDVPADAIDAIARRVVERMSEKVVREIAWEVVPELSELLIKQKLNDQR